MVKQKILVVDDEKDIHYAFRRAFGKEFKLDSAFTGEEALERVKIKSPDLVILDLKMPGMDGIKALSELKKINPKLCIIVVTGHGDMDAAIKVMKSGAYDYISKPFDLAEINTVIERALLVKKAGEELVPIIYQAPDQSKLLPVIGKSKQMQKIYSLIAKIMSIDTTVLIQGETGTGKDLIAQSLYLNGIRAGNPFIVLNCAAIPEGLLESELFGHEKGAFTGAHALKQGKLELANGGTLFLDEIGDMPLTIQSKVLRVLEGKSFTHIGGTHNISTDVRFIAATNKDLLELISEKRFRKDLFYRLNVVNITIPPLRERREDILELVEHFVGLYSTIYDKKIRFISSEARKFLLQYDWPGNVRELENMIEHIVTIASGDTLLLSHFPKSIKPKRKELPTVNFKIGTSLAKVEKEYIEQTLKAVNGNQFKASKLLNLHRNTLHRKMEKYGLTTLRLPKLGGEQ